MWFALSPLAAPVRSWSKPEEKVERPQPLVRKCVWERAQAPAFKQRRDFIPAVASLTGNTAWQCADCAKELQCKAMQSMPLSFRPQQGAL